MQIDTIDESLESQVRPLLERKLVFVKTGYLHNTSKGNLKENMPKIIENQQVNNKKNKELCTFEQLKTLISEYSQTNQKLKNVGTGLQNLGNTCFLNSALQCLLHTPPLCSYLIQKSHSKNCTQKANNFCALCSLERLSEKSRIKKENKRSVAPIEIIKNIKAVGKQFKALRQEDCHEFMRCFVDSMQISSINFDKKMPREIQETSVISRIFGGKLRSKVTCNSCQNESIINENFMDLSLETNKSNGIYQCFDNFFRVEHLSKNNKYSCNHCKKLTDADKQFSIDEGKFLIF